MKKHHMSYGKKVRIYLVLQREIFPEEEKRNINGISNETINEVEKRRKLKAKDLSDSVNVTEYNKQNALVQQMMGKDKENYINEQCKCIEDNSITNSVEDLYQGVKNLANKFKPTIDTIKDENGKILGEAEEVKERWVHYSTDLHKKSKYCCPGTHICSER